MVKMLIHRLVALKGEVLAYDLLKSMCKWIEEEDEINDKKDAGVGPSEGQGS